MYNGFKGKRETKEEKISRLFKNTIITAVIIVLVFIMLLLESTADTKKTEVPRPSAELRNVVIGP